MAENFKNAIFAAVLTAIMTIPIFGLQLVRQGAQTQIVPDWDLVLLGIASVFVVHLIRTFLYMIFLKV